MNIIELFEKKEKTKQTNDKIKKIKDEIASLEEELKKEETQLSELKHTCDHDVVLGFELSGRKSGKCLICGSFIQENSFSKKIIQSYITVNNESDINYLERFIIELEKFMHLVRFDNPEITYEELLNLIQDKLTPKTKLKK